MSRKPSKTSEALAPFVREQADAIFSAVASRMEAPSATRERLVLAAFRRAGGAAYTKLSDDRFLIAGEIYSLALIELMTTKLNQPKPT